MSDTPSKSPGKRVMVQAAGVLGFWRSLRARLVLLVLLASAPLLAITLYTANQIRNGEVESARVELQGLSQLAEGRLQQAVQASEHLLGALSQMPAIARGDAAECARVFGHILGKAQRYTNFVVTDAEGRTLCDGVNPNRRLDLGGRTHFKQARATRRFVVGDPVIGLSSGRAAMALAYPLLDAGGNFRGAILSGMDLQWFGELFANAMLYPNLTFAIWTPDGTIMYRYPEPEKWVSKRFPETEITKTVLSRQAEMVVVEAADLTGAQNLYAITGIERWAGNRIAFSIGIPKAELFARSDRTFSHTLGYFGIVLVLTLAAAFLVAEYSIRRRIAALADASERLAAGDLSARTGLPPGADELGALANSFDAMAQAMQRQVEDIRRGEEEYRALNADLEQRVASRTTELQSANRLKSEFLASMSHELRTPLNGIIGFSEFLVDEKPGKLNDKQKEYLNDILNSGRHLLQLINDVLDLSKVEAGKMELFPETFSLPKAVDEVCSVISQLAEKKGITIRKGIAPGIESVTLDPQKFKQVLYNLLSNAVKFTDGGGRVEIVASPDDSNRLRVQVRDTGIGIKPEDFKKLFVEFQQLDAGATRRYEGTGLGLALTKKIVEFQKGTITMESESGKGSTFTVILPLVDNRGRK